MTGLPRRLDAAHAADTDASTVGLLESETDADTDRPWSVIVWNDPINLMSYVTLIIQKVFGYSHEKATTLMLDVHHKGRAVVSSGTRTDSERYVHQLHGHGLWATMEHDE